MKVSRKKQKAETRQKLMDVTAAELASGRSFDTLSLREVAKLAGIAPTSFYRHFHDMEGLGLALIEEHGEGLVTLMHDVRDQTSNGRSLIRASVETLFEYIFSNQGISRMILQESMARESVFREAAEKLFSSMSSDLAEFLVLDAEKRGVPMSHPELAANSAVAILFTTGIALLNTPVSDRDRYIEAAIIKLRMIMRGAEAMVQGR
ncbi:MAG: HTH-type transcriptional repressor FabR [Gammaproteobacteria bacterium]|nr:HTH-type transcriptional repressor FabR [Gammaproteobacteria bacterium]